MGSVCLLGGGISEVVGFGFMVLGIYDSTETSKNRYIAMPRVDMCSPANLMEVQISNPICARKFTKSRSTLPLRQNPEPLICIGQVSSCFDPLGIQQVS